MICSNCARKFEIEETYELVPLMNFNTNSFVYECPDCGGQVVEEIEKQVVKNKPNRKTRKFAREQKAFY
jgi:DNA-directed RNA polymerase subunit RPC12/RpoP